MTVPKNTLHEHEAQLRTTSGPSIYERKSTTRMGAHSPEAISHEDGPFQNQMVVTGDSFPGVRFLSAESARVIGRAALPRLHHPPSGFRTLSAVFAHPNLVALFHATSTPRILVFRAFPSSPAAISLDIRCSLVVSPVSDRPRLPGFLRPPLPSLIRLALEG